jgi:hypothetical protein
MRVDTVPLASVSVPGSTSGLPAEFASRSRVPAHRAMSDIYQSAFLKTRLESFSGAALLSGSPRRMP